MLSQRHKKRHLIVFALALLVLPSSAWAVAAPDELSPPEAAAVLDQSMQDYDDAQGAAAFLATELDEDDHDHAEIALTIAGTLHADLNQVTEDADTLLLSQKALLREMKSDQKRRQAQAREHRAQAQGTKNAERSYRLRCDHPSTLNKASRKACQEAHTHLLLAARLERYLTSLDKQLDAARSGIKGTRELIDTLQGLHAETLAQVTLARLELDLGATSWGFEQALQTHKRSLGALRVQSASLTSRLTSLSASVVQLQNTYQEDETLDDDDMVVIGSLF